MKLQRNVWIAENFAYMKPEERDAYRLLRDKEWSEMTEEQRDYVLQEWTHPLPQDYITEAWESMTGKQRTMLCKKHEIYELSRTFITVTWGDMNNNQKSWILNSDKIPEDFRKELASRNEALYIAINTAFPVIVRKIAQKAQLTGKEYDKISRLFFVLTNTEQFDKVFKIWEYMKEKSRDEILAHKMPDFFISTIWHQLTERQMVIICENQKLTKDFIVANWEGMTDLAKHVVKEKQELSPEFLQKLELQEATGLINVLDGVLEKTLR